MCECKTFPRHFGALCTPIADTVEVQAAQKRALANDSGHFDTRQERSTKHSGHAELEIKKQNMDTVATGEVSTGSKWLWQAASHMWVRSRRKVSH